MANVINSLIWKKTGVDSFEKLLDLTAYRHKLISGNIANVNTPDYAAKDIDFQGEIDKALGGGNMLAMKVTNPGHIGNTGPNSKIEVQETEAETDDQLNGVDIDKEATNLAVNQMRYTIGAKILQNKINALRKAIRGS